LGSIWEYTMSELDIGKDMDIMTTDENVGTWPLPRRPWFQRYVRYLRNLDDH
jgi:hypothetical protein